MTRKSNGSAHVLVVYSLRESLSVLTSHPVARKAPLHRSSMSPSSSLIRHVHFFNDSEDCLHGPDVLAHLAVSRKILPQARSCPGWSNQHKRITKKTRTTTVTRIPLPDCIHAAAMDPDPKIRAGGSGGQVYVRHEMNPAIRPQVILIHCPVLKWRYSDQYFMVIMKSARTTDRSVQAGLGPRKEMGLIGLVM